MRNLEADQRTVERIAQRLDAQGLTYSHQGGAEPRAHLSYLEACTFVRLARAHLEHEVSKGASMAHARGN